MDERRSEVRLLCADMVEVRWKDRAGNGQRTTAILEDICASGACLQVEEPIPLGVEIRWDQPKQVFQGYVRYCVYREIGYFVGVEFDASFKWSKKAFKPQHLLDLQTLVARSEK
ncbi:MAG: PilZ domain-containing protein [Candidatus Solibacter sp.]|nr:PilZ domain-containing protein [Candidatus Solibacter sp.]